MENNTDKKIIAWGKSKMLEFYVDNTPGHKIDFIIDSNPKAQNKKFRGIHVYSPDVLIGNTKKDNIVVFAVSSLSLQAILAKANVFGYELNKNIFLYSDLFFNTFSKKVLECLDSKPSQANHNFVKSISLTSKIPIHTTLLGNLLFLQLLSKIIDRKQTLAIAEVGAFNGGNAFIASIYMSQHRKLPFYIFDSFEGFPEISEFDPQNEKKGDYNIETTFEYIQDLFALYDNVSLIKGFIPNTFKTLDKNASYGLVFYDCDLYEPALETFKYFWDKIIPGGFMLVHDYIAEEGGFTGVKKATDEFFKSKDITIYPIWETTMALIKK